MDIETRGAVEGAQATPRGVLAAAPKPRESARAAAERKRREAEARNQRHRRTRDLRTALADAEATAAATERELDEITQRLADPSIYADASVVRTLVERHNHLRDRTDALAADRERLPPPPAAAEAEAGPVAAR